MAGRKKRGDGGEKGRKPGDRSGCRFSPGGAGLNPQDGQILKVGAGGLGPTEPLQREGPAG